VVRVRGAVSVDMLHHLRDGVLLADGVAIFSDIQMGRVDEDSANHWYYVVLLEGRNREVRRLWESQGLTVSRLKRVRFGNLLIPSVVRAGRYVDLKPRQIRELYNMVDLSPPA
ncbi:MAG: hypothetical protein WD601_08365, partial [Pseudohongiellaceae bacterium]